MNRCFTIAFAFSLFHGACGVQTPGNDVRVRVEFESATATSFYPFPIIQIENNGSQMIYVYLLQWHYEVKVDSLTGSVLLDYAVDDALYLGMTQYEFTRPVFIGVDPYSKIRLHSRPISELVLRRDVIPALPEKGIYARIGYLRGNEVFAGRLDHLVRSQILKFQETVSSARIYREVRSNKTRDD